MRSFESTYLCDAEVVWKCTAAAMKDAIELKTVPGSRTDDGPDGGARASVSGGGPSDSPSDGQAIASSEHNPGGGHDNSDGDDDPSICPLLRGTEGPRESPLLCL